MTTAAGTGNATQQQARGSFPFVDQPIPIRERVRLTGYSLRRAAWRMHYRHPQLDVPPHEPILVVLGMHRSGTSAAVGILEELGFSVPGTIPPDGTGDNKRGTREPLELTSLTNDVLQLNGSSWREPPTRGVKYTKRQIAARNALIRQCSRGGHVLKDPRMLLMLELWRGVSANAMAVVRNPVDVAESLVRRGEPLTLEEGIALWAAYNRELLNYARARDCPIALFDRPDFADQVIQCVKHHGYSDHTAADFFSGQLVRSRTTNWRDTTTANVATLYDELAELSISKLTSNPRETGNHRTTPG